MSDQQATTHVQPHHPVGTLVIVGLYGLLFVVGWLAVYFFVFRAREAVTP